MQQICEKCGKVNLADAIHCAGCNHDLRTQDATVILGAAATAAVKAVAEPSPPTGLASRFNTCPQCATVNVANASVCRACGCQLAAGVPTPAVVEASLAPMSDLDDTQPPLKNVGAATVAGASKSKKQLWIALGAGGLLVAAVLAWWLLGGSPASPNMPVKPNPFALPPEAMVSAPATTAATPTPALAPSQGTAEPVQNSPVSLPLVSQTLDPKETIVAPSTPPANTVRNAATSDATTKQAPPSEQTANASSKKEAKASDAPRPAAQPAAVRTTNTAPAKESAAARPSAAVNPGSSAAPAPAETAAAGQPAAAAQAGSPKEVCSTRFLLAQPFCMQEQCGLPRFTNHAQCVQMRAQQQETQQRMQEKN